MRIEEIHLIIRYPIQDSWEKLDIVETVRWKTVEKVKDVALNMWKGVEVEVINGL